VYVLFFLLISFACAVLKSDEGCAVYYDKCEYGCEPLCGTITDRDRAQRGMSCDIGCMDTGIPDCVLKDGVCQWAE